MKPLICVVLFVLFCRPAEAEIIAAIDYDTTTSSHDFAFTFETNNTEPRDAVLVSSGLTSVGTHGNVYTGEADFSNMATDDIWFGFGILSRTAVSLPTFDPSRLSTTAEFWSSGIGGFWGVDEDSASGTFAVVFDYSDAALNETRFEFEMTHRRGNSHLDPAEFSGSLADATQTGTILDASNFSLVNSVQFELAGRAFPDTAAEPGFGPDAGNQLFLSNMTLSSSSAAVPEPGIVWPLALLMSFGAFRAYRRRQAAA